MARWRQSFYKLVPSWLSTGDGEKVLYSLGRLTDGFIERTRRSLTARFPTYSGPTGLAMLGDERGIIQGRGENAAGYARRLRGWRGLRGHQVRGNPYAMLFQIWNYFGGITTREIDAAGNVFTTAADGTESVTHGGVWNWDSSPPLIPGSGDPGAPAAPAHDPSAGSDVPDLLNAPGQTANLVLHCNGTPGSLIFLHIGTGAANTSLTVPDSITGRGWNLLSETQTTAGTGNPYTQRVFWRITGPYESFTSVNVVCTHAGTVGNVRFIGRAVNVPGTYVEQNTIVEADTFHGNGTTVYTPQLAQDTPFLRAAGAVAFASTGGTLAVPYPNGPEPLQVGDTFYMQLTKRSSTGAPTTPAGWSLVSGPDSNGSTGTSWLYVQTAKSTGTEGGTSLSLATGSSTGSVSARIYAFANVSAHEVVTATAGIVGNLIQPTLTPTGYYRECVAFLNVVVAGSTAQTITAFGGQVGGTWSKACDDAASTDANGSILQGLQVAPEAFGGAIADGALTTTGGGIPAMHGLCLIGTPVRVPFAYKSLGLLFVQGRLTTYSAASNGWTELDSERTAGGTGIGIDEQWQTFVNTGLGPGVVTLGATSAINVTAVRVVTKLPQSPYRFWLQVVTDTAFNTQTDAGADVPGACVGMSGMNAADANVLRGLFSGDHTWNCAGTRPEWCIMSPTGTVTDPGGIYGHWSRSVGGVQVEARDKASRYVSLNPTVNNAYAGVAGNYPAAMTVPGGGTYTGTAGSFPASFTLPDGTTYTGALGSFPETIQLFDDGSSFNK